MLQLLRHAQTVFESNQAGGPNMSGKTGGAGGGGKQDARKKGKVKGGGRNKEQERRVTGTRHEPSVRTPE